MVESTRILGHDVFPANLQSEDYISWFLKLSSGLDGPRMFGRAIAETHTDPTSEKPGIARFQSKQHR